MDARDSSPVPVHALTQVGISMTDIVKLQQAGIYSLTKLDAISRCELVTIKGLSEDKIDKMKEGIQQLTGDGVIISGDTGKWESVPPPGPAPVPVPTNPDDKLGALILRVVTPLLGEEVARSYIDMLKHEYVGHHPLIEIFLPLPTTSYHFLSLPTTRALTSTQCYHQRWNYHYHQEYPVTNIVITLTAILTHYHTRHCTNHRTHHHAYGS